MGGDATARNPRKVLSKKTEEPEAEAEAEPEPEIQVDIEPVVVAAAVPVGAVDESKLSAKERRKLERARLREKMQWERARDEAKLKGERAPPMPAFKAHSVAIQT